MHAATTFCQHVGLTINTAKSHHMVFKQEGPQQSLRSNVLCIDHVHEVKYLGLIFNSAHGILSCSKDRQNKMLVAWAVLKRQYAGLRCSLSVPLFIALYNACVAPVGSYECEIWGFLKMPADLLKHICSI